jgi:hypothetical protein
MGRLCVLLAFSFFMPFLPALIGCGSTSPPLRPEAPALPVTNDLQQMQQFLEAGEVHRANKQYGEARSKFKRASDLASRAVQAPATPEERRAAMAGRDKANLGEAGVLAVLAADTSLLPFAKKGFLSDARSALDGVDRKDSAEYQGVNAEVERLTKEMEPAPPPEPIPPVVLPLEEKAVPPLPSPVVESPAPPKKSGKPKVAKVSEIPKPLPVEPVIKDPPPVRPTKKPIEIPPPPPGKHGETPSACGPAPPGAVTLTLKNDKDGVGGSFSGRLAMGQSASHAILVCSRGDLEAVVPEGFRIEGDDFSFTGAKNYPGGKFGLRWAARLTPGKLVKFRVIADKQQASEDYKVRYYLYPR